MKILHINDHYCNLGGAEKYLLDICNAQEELGHQIVIIASSENATAQSNGRKVYSVKGSYGLRSSLKTIGIFARIVEKEKPDIIHLHNLQLASPLIIKFLSQRKPIVMTVHDIRFLCPATGWKIIPASNIVCEHFIGRNCIKNGCYPFYPDGRNLFWNLHKFIFDAYRLRNLKKIDKLIAPSSFISEQLSISRFPSKKIVVIPHYTDKVFARKNDTGRNDKKIILYVGHISKHKGIMQFIESLGLLINHDWTAEIIGDGKLIDDAKALVERLDIEDRVSFLGRIPNEEIDNHYSKCSLVVMPSMIPESFGLVGIEAMAFGKPVIAYDAGGIREWLVHNETGLLVERGNIRMLSESIDQLLTDDEARINMGRHALEKVEKDFKKSKHMDSIMKVYLDILQMNN